MQNADQTRERQLLLHRSLYSTLNTRDAQDAADSCYRFYHYELTKQRRQSPSMHDLTNANIHGQTLGVPGELLCMCIDKLLTFHV
jgi:hypothetical protein